MLTVLHGNSFELNRVLCTYLHDPKKPTSALQLYRTSAVARDAKGIDNKWLSYLSSLKDPALSRPGRGSVISLVFVCTISTAAGDD